VREAQVEQNARGARGRVQSHRDLIVWQKAMDLAVAIYRHSERFPREEVYRLTSQITRAAASVPANIAVGFGRSTTRSYAHFLSIAQGSLMETETFLMLAIRLGYVDEAETASSRALVTEVSKMLSVLRRRLVPANEFDPR
jgi:four helix bundle protein